MEKERGLKIMKFSDGNYLKMLEAGIKMGNPVLMENVLEDMDPAIEPLLQKQIYITSIFLFYGIKYRSL
jgi:dynein heavy chain